MYPDYNTPRRHVCSRVIRYRPQKWSDTQAAVNAGHAVRTCSQALNHPHLPASAGNAFAEIVMQRPLCVPHYDAAPHSISFPEACAPTGGGGARLSLMAVSRPGGGTLGSAPVNSREGRWDASRPDAVARELGDIGDPDSSIFWFTSPGSRRSPPKVFLDADT